MPHHAAPRRTTPHHAAPRRTTPHHAAPRCTSLHLAAPRCTSLHLAAPRCTSLRTLLTLASLVAILGACDSNTPVQPPDDLELPASAPPAALLPARAAAPPALMPLQLDNANSCTVHLQPSRTTRTSSRMALPGGGKTISAATVLSRIQFIRWDGVSKQPSALIDCVIPRDREAVAAAKEYFLRGDGAGIGRRARDDRAPNVSAMTHDFYDGMTCWYDSGFNSFDCDGVQCVFGGNAMWVDAEMGTGTVSSPSNTAALAHPRGQYSCDNGCTLWANGLGGVGFYCPEDEGDGDEPPPGGGPSGPPPPPSGTDDPILPSCSASQNPLDDGWDTPGPEPLNMPGVEVCSGSGSASCLKSSPGIWVGSWLISAQWNTYIRARHTASARSTSSSIWVTELLGPWPVEQLFEVAFHFEQPAPYYATFDDYRWVKVAGSSAMSAYQNGASRARAEFENWIYLGSSNRFVSTILKGAGIQPTYDMFQAIGFAPGIAFCFYW